MSMKMGIQKCQWLFLFLLLSLPLLLNAVAIWLDIGADGVMHLLNGTYNPNLSDSLFNPSTLLSCLSQILSELLPIIAMLGILVWLALLASNRPFFQRQWLIAILLETLLVVLFLAKVFEIATGILMPLAWLPKFHDIIGLLPGSPFMEKWSRWFIFPATAIILFAAMTLSRNRNLESKKIDKTVNAL